MPRPLSILLVASIAFLANPLRAADAAKTSPEGIDYFEKHIRPILVDSCYKCHSAQSEKLKAVLYVDEDLQMPPKKQLDKEQVAALQTWVKMGAPDPRPDPATAAAATSA